MMFLPILLIGIIIFLISYVIYHRYSYFFRRSIPSPAISSIIFGHLSELWSVQSYSEQLRQWTLQYGSIYGIFEGTRPLYIVSDMKFIEEVYVKQFARFYARRTAFASRILGNTRSNVFTANLPQLWKRQRMILNPTFSGAKMRRLLPTVDLCINTFLERLSMITNGTIINIYEIYKRLTMDVICQCAFSIDTKVQNDMNNNNIYMKKIEELFAKDFERTNLGKIHRIISHTRLARICSLLYQLKQFFHCQTSSLPANFWLIENMQKFIQQRVIELDNKKRVDDFIQLMIDAVHSEKGQLSSSELFSNAFVLLVAGFETTSTALGYCTYRLAIHQDIQAKLYEEILEHWSSETNCYDVIMTKLTYLDYFVKEVLRMYPIATQAINRQCMEDTDVVGYQIEKGSLIQVDVFSVHFNQELWGPEAVEEFHPERHSQKRNPLAFLTFGGGPRTCLGMRFALMEIKLCLVRLINEYQLLPASDEKYKMNIREHIVIQPEKVFVRLEKRST
ncbi:unnamed protein product [Adineta steineri]|uniref:Cytochrome P450 n=4 Tax=Adineta steineri TaxID=433720 RepID=A0A819KCU3_9BILA|nr:unnamed protein product [Adineta steineri]